MTTTRSWRRARSMRHAGTASGASPKTSSTSSRTVTRTTGTSSRPPRGRWPNGACRPNAAASSGTSRCPPRSLPSGCGSFRCSPPSLSMSCSGSPRLRARSVTSRARSCSRRARSPKAPTSSSTAAASPRAGSGRRARCRHQQRWDSRKRCRARRCPTPCAPRGVPSRWP